MILVFQVSPKTPTTRFLTALSMPKSFLIRRLLGLLKLLLAVLLIGYLLYQVAQNKSFQPLKEQPKNWPLLAAAVFLTLASALLSFIRWQILVKTIGLPFSLRDALRLGSLGYLLNFASLGSVGGDLFKAFFLAKEQPRKKTEAVATVVVDRMVGLYGLLLVASLALWVTGLRDKVAGTNIIYLCDGTYVLTAIGAMVICLLLVPGFTGGKASALVRKIPVAGKHFVRLLQTVRLYRSKLPVVLFALVLSLGVHGMLTLAVYCIATGFPMVVPTLAQHYFVVPLAMIAGALPLTPNGLGTFEATLEALFQHVPQIKEITQGTGTLVALGYRVTTLAVAGIGAAYYFSARREIEEVLHDVEEAEEEQ